MPPIWRQCGIAVVSAFRSARTFRADGIGRDLPQAAAVGPRDHDLTADLAAAVERDQASVGGVVGVVVGCTLRRLRQLPLAGAIGASREDRGHRIGRHEAAERDPPVVAGRGGLGGQRSEQRGHEDEYGDGEDTHV